MFPSLFFSPTLFVVRIEYLNITSACETAWVVNCKSEIPQNRDCQKGYVTCLGLSTDLKTPRCESLIPGLKMHVQIFCNCSSIKRFKVKPQALMLIEIYCVLFSERVFFTYCFFFSFLVSRLLPWVLSSVSASPWLSSTDFFYPIVYIGKCLHCRQ